MAIANYKLRYEAKLDKIMSSDDITKENKEALNKFWKIYDVSDARKDIFLDHIIILLTSCNNIIKDMHNADKIINIFHRWKGKLGAARFETLKNVSNRFVRLLNDNQKPKGFASISSSNGRKQRRKLHPGDMITWDDGLKMIEQTNSVQLKALIMTMLDGGFRPAELQGLKFGDIERKKDMMIAYVQDGKTGSRPVILYRCVPFLSRWLSAHPKKDKKAPLWIREFEPKGSRQQHDKGIVQYNYYALSKRIKELGQKAGIRKPLDVYNFRHSAAVLAKKDNLPLEECAKKFGHSVVFFTEVYGRLSPEDSIERIGKAYGIKEQKAKIENNTVCGRCDNVNEPGAEYCEKCSAALNLKIALKEESSVKAELETFKNQVFEMFKQQERDRIKAEAGIR